MSGTSTVLCIHRDPDHFSLLREKGYALLIATNGGEGLRLLMTKSVDAVILEYYLGLLDGAVVASEIKKVRPQIPIVMLADHLELPDGALKSVDALVTKSDGAYFLWDTIHFVLNVKPTLHEQAALSAQAPLRHRRPESSMGASNRRQASPAPTATDDKDVSFSAKVRRKIMDGSLEF